MSGLPGQPQLSPITTAQLPAGNFDQLLGRAKKGLDLDSRESYTLCVLAPGVNIFSLASVGASQANTTVQAYFVLPGRLKIPKITAFCSAISAVTGLSFNIVLGTTGAYTQGNVPGNDNSSVPPVGYNARGETVGAGGSGSNAQVYPAGGGGIASDPAQIGQCMFPADVVFNTTNFPNLTTGAGTNANSNTATSAQDLVPASPDAIWPRGGVLTLRITTPSGGSITNLIISAVCELQPLQASYPGSNFPIFPTAEPGTDF